MATEVTGWQDSKGCFFSSKREAEESDIKQEIMDGIMQYYPGTVFTQFSAQCAVQYILKKYDLKRKT